MTPSPFIDTTSEFQIPAIDFARALNDSGFVQAAIQVGLEAADAARQKGSEGSLSEEWGQIEANVLSEEELSELQALLAAIASGADLSQLRATLSPRMLKILERILATVDAARLRGLIGEVLGFEIEEDETKVLLSPVWGASDVHVPQRAFRVTAKSTVPGAFGGAPSSHSSSSIKPQA
ncbi:MAG: hypothetical protein WKF84_12605 [Pyrinomonadaceae bacterium]